MNTHVFIVDSITFKIHLEFLFAGTGAKDNIIDFNNCPQSRLYPTTENMLVSMIADASRIRKEDLIIFYLQQNFQQGIREGKFYGIFKASEDLSFLDNNDCDQYLQNELVKSLTFRTLIKPYKVYVEGVTEWEALDEIKNIHSPDQMLWSLIYRKLKGNRGNTMITIYESERLCQLIRNKNNRNEIEVEDRLLSFDVNTERIICEDNPINNYEGRKEDINILPRLLRKLNEGKSFEPHLQAYITQNIGRTNNTIDNIVVGDANIEWIGNEVSCGVGMQRIDIMLSVLDNDQRVIVPIELKAMVADESVITQIQRYIDWIEQYYIPNRHSDIQPVLVSKQNNNKTGAKYDRLVASFQEFNSNNRNRCSKLKYVEFDVVDSSIVFNQVQY